MSHFSARGQVRRSPFGGFMVTAQRVETDIGIVQVLGVKGACADVCGAANINRIPDGNDEFDAGIDKLFVDLFDDIRRGGVGVIPIIADRPLRVGNHAKRPDLA